MNYVDIQDPNNPPEIPEPARLVREVMADNPRVTRFPIDFGRGLPEEFAPPGGSSADAMGDDGQIQISQVRGLPTDGSPGSLSSCRHFLLLIHFDNLEIHNFL